MLEIERERVSVWSSEFQIWSENGLLKQWSFDVICLGFTEIKTLQLKDLSSPSKHMCSSSLERSKVGKCRRGVAWCNSRVSGSVLLSELMVRGCSGLRLRLSGFKVEDQGAARFTGKPVGRLLLQFRGALKMANGWCNHAAIWPFPEQIT